MEKDGFENFESYYGVTDIKALKEYAEQCKNEPERQAMFLRLVELKESGVVYTPSYEGGKLHYSR